MAVVERGEGIVLRVPSMQLTMLMMMMMMMVIIHWIVVRDRMHPAVANTAMSHWIQARDPSTTLPRLSSVTNSVVIPRDHYFRTWITIRVAIGVVVGTCWMPVRGLHVPSTALRPSRWIVARDHLLVRLMMMLGIIILVMQGCLMSMRGVVVVNIIHGGGGE